MVLPALPASDGKSIEWNRFDGFYEVKSRDFWKNAEIIREEVGLDRKCIHEFEATPDGAQCIKCHFGLSGVLQVKEGKLYHNGEQLPL